MEIFGDVIRIRDWNVEISYMDWNFRFRDLASGFGVKILRNLGSGLRLKLQNLRDRDYNRDPKCRPVVITQPEKISDQNSQPDLIELAFRHTSQRSLLSHFWSLQLSSLFLIPSFWRRLRSPSDEYPGLEIRPIRKRNRALAWWRFCFSSPR